MMKTLRLILILSLCAVLMSCRGASQTVTGYAFHNLVVDFPSSCEITKLEEQDNPPLASFVLVDKDNADSQIEFAISEFDKDFLSTVPREELMGELVASVFDMKENVLSAPGVVAEKIGEMTVSRKGERPEAYMFITVSEKGKTVYVILSSMIVGNYNITTASRASDPSTMEMFTTITDNIRIL